MQYPRAGSVVVRIDPIRFLAGCRKRLLNQVLSVLYLSMFFWTGLTLLNGFSFLVNFFLFWVVR